MVGEYQCHQPVYSIDSSIHARPWSSLPPPRSYLSFRSTRSCLPTRTLSAHGYYVEVIREANGQSITLSVPKHIQSFLTILSLKDVTRSPHHKLRATTCPAARPKRPPVLCRPQKLPGSSWRGKIYIANSVGYRIVLATSQLAAHSSDTALKQLHASNAWDPTSPATPTLEKPTLGQLGRLHQQSLFTLRNSFALDHLPWKISN